MKVITTKQMQLLDRQTIQSGVAAEELMFAAGEVVTDAIKTLAGNHQLVDAPVLLVAGPGNNGGDAFVTAKLLHEDGWPVECWLVTAEANLKGAALVHFKKMKKAGVPFEVLDSADHWAYVTEGGVDVEIVVDAVLGTGFEGEPRGMVASAIEFMNAQAERALVVAVDMPSAMAVRSDLTVTLGLPKTELLDPEYADFVGMLEVGDIGLPPEFVAALEGDDEVELIHPSDLSPLFRRRSRVAHKGDFGSVLCVGGSKGYCGAVVLAGRAALRSGAGRVSLTVPESVYNAVAPAVPEAMVHTVLLEDGYSSVLVGPGMGRSATTCEQVLELLAKSTVPVVLDADAISVLGGQFDAIAKAKAPVVLTPHLGEFATLFDLKLADVQEDRLGMARMAADKLGATVVLKGAGTIVAHPGIPLAMNMTGNPGMAVGGSGDVLGGLIVGLLAQGVGPFEASCAAVWMHGRAGDLAAAEKSQAALLPQDLIAKIPEAQRDLSCR